MEQDTQEYEVTLKFTYTEKVFEGDPDDRFELAEFEEDDLIQLLQNRFTDCDIKNIKVLPIITPGK